MSKKIAVLYSLDTEITPLRQRLGAGTGRDEKKGTVTEAQAGPNRVLLVKAGIGGAGIQMVLDTVEKKHRPDLYLLTGFAGAADPRFNTGDVLVPRQLVDIDTETYEPDNDGLLPADALAGCDRNAVLTTVGRMYQAEDKKKLYSLYSRDRAVDMESGYFAAWAAVHAKKWCVVKAVSDTFKAQLPSADFIKRFFNGTNDKADLLRLTYRHPFNFYRLVRLNKNCARAAGALADALVPVLSGL